MAKKSEQQLPLAVPDSLLVEVLSSLIVRKISFRAEHQADVPGLWHIYRQE